MASLFWWSVLVVSRVARFCSRFWRFRPVWSEQMAIQVIGFGWLDSAWSAIPVMVVRKWSVWFTPHARVFVVDAVWNHAFSRGLLVMLIAGATVPLVLLTTVLYLVLSLFSAQDGSTWCCPLLQGIMWRVWGNFKIGSGVVGFDPRFWAGGQVSTVLFQYRRFL